MCPARCTTVPSNPIPLRPCRGGPAPVVATAAAAPAFAASPFESDCGLRLVKTDGLTDPETFSTISAGSTSGGLTQEGSVGTVWIPSARCGCGVKDLALHHSVPCPDSKDGSVPCADPQVRQVSLTLSGSSASSTTGIVYLANPYDYGCRTQRHLDRHHGRRRRPGWTG